MLNHDKPSLIDGTIRYDYNTTDDVLDYLVTRRRASSVKTTYIALCFKSIPLDRCDENSEWVGLVDDFFVKANEILFNYSLNVEFVLDSGVPAKCHADRWRPWVSTSTWTEDALFSNNVTLGYDRYQVLNPNAAASQSKRRKLSGASCGDFASCAELKFGKFANDTTSFHSYQVYAAFEQVKIKVYIGFFFETGVRHDPGLRFAINIDPAMFQVYSAAKDEVNKKDAAGRSEVFASMSSKPMIARIREEKLMTAFMASQEIMSYHIGSAYDTPSFRNISLTSPMSQLSSDGDKMILISHSDGEHELYRLSLFEDSLVLHKHFRIENVTSSRLIDSAQGLIVSVSTTLDGCDLTLLIIGLKDYQVLDSICLENGVSLVDNNDTSISYDVTKVSENSYAALVMYSSSVQMYGTWVNFSVSEEMTISFQTMRTSPQSPRFLAPGRDPSVSLVQNGDIQALVVYADGFCYNNEVRNKYAGIGVCDQVPWSIPTSLRTASAHFKPLGIFFLATNHSQHAVKRSHTEHTIRDTIPSPHCFMMIMITFISWNFTKV